MQKIPGPCLFLLFSPSGPASRHPPWPCPRTSWSRPCLPSATPSPSDHATWGRRSWQDWRLAGGKQKAESTPQPHQERWLSNVAGKVGFMDPFLETALCCVQVMRTGAEYAPWQVLWQASGCSATKPHAIELRHDVGLHQQGHFLVLHWVSSPNPPMATRKVLLGPHPRLRSFKKWGLPKMATKAKANNQNLVQALPEPLK